MTSCSPADPDGVDQADHPEDVALRVGEGDEAAAFADGAVGLAGAAEQVLAAPRRLLRVRVRSLRAGPGLEVPVAVLDRHGQSGELVDRARDALAALAGHGHRGEPVVDLDAALQRAERPAQPSVDLGELLRRGELLRVQVTVGQRRTGLLRERAQEELLLAGGLHVGGHDEHPEPARRAAQRIAPRPTPRSRPPPGRRRARVPGAGPLDRGRVSGLERHDAAPGQRRHGGDRQLEDLALPRALGHELPQDEQAAHGREQPASELVRGVQLGPGHASGSSSGSTYQGLSRT